MFLFETIILFVCLTPAVVKGDVITTINCPRFCKCDSYLQLNRAQCSSKRLISAEVILPNQVEILDLSYNHITTVDSKCFATFLHLKYLNLSHNGLHTLDWDAFAKLRHLTEIDLAHNRLEYLDERLFAKNKVLRKINLAGNKFGSLQDKPFLSTPYVKELNLKNSQINSLQPKYFSHLKTLQRLDLSENLLNNFNTEDFQNLWELKALNLSGNFIRCDDTMKNKLKQLKKRGIDVVMDNCLNENHVRVQQKTKMFERLIAATQQTDKEVYELANKINNWRLNLDSDDNSIEEPIEADFDSKIIPENPNFKITLSALLCNKKNVALCQEYRSCLQNLNKAWRDQHKNKNQAFSDARFAFIMGIAIGTSAVVLLIACVLCVKILWKTKETASPSSCVNDLHTHPLARPTNQLPPSVRSQPRRRTTYPPSSLVRYEGPVTESFLTRLFGRPARRQYYRTINQNTSTLIRRLSRSNLFNNRLSQHFIDRQTSGEASSSQVEELASPATSATRPETPPPLYGDVVINNSCAAK